MESGLDNPATAGGLRVLVADDSASNVLLLKRFLMNAGHQVETAPDGGAVLVKFFPGAFDLVILDMRMPVLNGYAVAREIRARETAAAWAPPVPIIALTGNSQPDEIQRSREAGCTLFLGKPFFKADLLNLVAQASQGAPRAFAADASPHPDPDIADMVPLFLERRRQEMPLITQALGRGEYEAVEEFGHKTAGAGGSYGFPQISMLGKRIESAAKARDGTAAGLGLKELAAYLQTLSVAP